MFSDKFNRSTLRSAITASMCFVLLISTTAVSQTLGDRNILTGFWNGEEVEYVERQILIGLAPGVVPADVVSLLVQNNATVVEEFDRLNIGLLEIPLEADLFQTIEVLEQSPLVRYAEPNLVDHVFQTNPNDPYYIGTSPATYPHQWALNNTGQDPPGGTPDADIDAPEAWDYETGSSGILVAILDTGIPMQNGSLSHPDLNDANRIILGPDVSSETDGTVQDNNGHGTHVTGIALAETNNDTGIAGVCWNSKILVVQVFNAAGSASHQDFKEGVYAAVDSGAQIINYSGGGSHSQTKEEGVHYADSMGVFQSYAAGNSGSQGVIYPARYAFWGELHQEHQNGYESVISVAATQYDDERAWYSSYEPSAVEINVAAPGGAHDGGYPVDPGDIFSTTPNYSVTLNGYPYYVGQTYGYLPGTSMAAPHVSGLAALILSRFPNYTALDIRNLLEQSAEDVNNATYPGEDIYLGWGRINAYYAVAPPSAPQNLTLSNEGGNPRLRWNANIEPDLKEYHLYKELSINCFPCQVDTFVYVVTDTTYLDEWFNIGVRPPRDVVTYWVKAVDIADQKSGPSNSRYTKGQSLIQWKQLVEQSLPEVYSLSHNYPNPFNPVTTIKYDLPEESFVELRIFNLIGEEIRTLVSGSESAGFKSILWDGKDNSVNRVSSGMYIYKFSAKSLESDREFHQINKMVLIR